MRRLLLAGLIVGVVVVAGSVHESSQAVEQTATVQWGPYTVPGSSGGMPGSTDNLVQWAVAMPCADCYITSITPDLVFADGSNANHATMAMLHHMVLFATPTLDVTCSGFPWDYLGRRVFASGNERTEMAMPAGYGLYNPPNASWNLVVDIMNMMPEPRDMYLKFTFTYHPAADDLTPVTPVWLDVANCASSEYAIPAGYTETHWDWTSTLTGDIVAIGGHVHDYGIGVSAQRVEDGAYICPSVAGYGMGSSWAPAPVAPGDEGHPGSANELDPGDMSYMGRIEEMTGCEPYFRINAGETIRLHSSYNAPSSVPDVMGIMVAYVHETTDPPPDADGDGVRDELDNCPMWANPGQAMPPWPVPADDPDCDAYPTTLAAGSRAPESVIGTDESSSCAATAAANDEPLPDAWPVDFDDNQMVDGSDVLKFGAPFLSSAPGPPYAVRFDFNGDGFINGADVLQFGMFFLKSCSP